MTDSEIVLVQRAGDDVVVFGPASAIEQFGERLRDIPGPIVRAARHGIAAASETTTTLGEMSGAYLKLTPEAQQLLAAHDQASTAGGLLGFVRRGDGKIAGQLTFEPAMGAVSAAPALAGAAALQIQMAAIEQRLDAIQSDLGYLIKERHIEVEAETAANLEILSSVYGEVMITGELTATQWDRVVNIEGSVRQVFQRASMHLASIRQALEHTDGSLRERVAAMQQLINEDRTEQWLELYIHADRAVTEWELLHLYRQIDEHPDRVEELAAGTRQRVVERFAVLSGLANTLADLVGAEHDERWLDRFRLISRSRMEKLLIELGQILYSYRQGVAQVDLSNRLALSAADVACDGLDVLTALPLIDTEPDGEHTRRTLTDTLSEAKSRLPIRRRDGS